MSEMVLRQEIMGVILAMWPTIISTMLAVIRQARTIPLGRLDAISVASSATILDGLVPL